MRAVAATILVIGVLNSGLGMLPVTAMAADSATTDWPQWRGPTRNGIAGPGPNLADAWPEDGPKLLWKSGPIPCGCDPGGAGPFGGQQGGLGSVTVVGQQAFVYVHWKRKGGKVVITTKDLNGSGWREGVPDDLAKKVDEEIRKARADDPRDKRWKARLDFTKRDAFLNEFPATLDPKLVEKFGPWIRERGTIIWKTHPIEVKSWVDLAKMAEIRDQEFPTHGALMLEVKKRGISDDFFYGLQDLADRLATMGHAYTDTIVCLDVSSGKELWKKAFPGVPSTEMCYVNASGTPAVCDGKCYASGSAGLYCLDVKDGAVVWQAKTTLTHSSPLVANGGVFLMLREGLTAFDANTGKVLWTQPKVSKWYSSVVPWTAGNRHYLLAITGSGAYGIDPANGEVIWRGEGRLQQEYTPTICGDIVVCSPCAFRLTPGKGELLWNKGATAFDGSTPVVYQGYVYHIGIRYADQATCRDVKTGELKWQLRGYGQCTSAIAADGKIFGVFAPGKSRLIMFKATPEKCELLGLGSVQDPVPQGCTPSIANGRLFVRRENCVACYDITAAGNPGATRPKPAVADVERTTTTYRYGQGRGANGVVWEAVSAVDKGDSLDITDKSGKVTTVKKSDIDDVIKPGMTWQFK